MTRSENDHISGPQKQVNPQFQAVLVGYPLPVSADKFMYEKVKGLNFLGILQ